MTSIDCPRRRLLMATLATLATLPTGALLAATTRRPLAAQRLTGPSRRGACTLRRWEDLVPRRWDPMQRLKDQGVGTLAALDDGDPRALARMRRLREAWDQAPTDPALDGSRITLPGYLVPLQASAAGHTEFLLVPAFGACIHTPPPPANQIVRVLPAKPAAGFRRMDTVWVSGTLKTQRGNSAMGASGYRLESALVERYRAAPR